MTLPIGITLLIGIFVLVYFPSNQKKRSLKNLEEQLEISTKLLSFGIGVGLKNSDFGAIKAGYEQAQKINGFAYIYVLDEEGEIISQSNPGML